MVLVGAGSSRPEAAAELAATGRLLGERLGLRVPVRPWPTTCALPSPPAGPPVRVATYLLAEGQFVTTLRAAAAGCGRSLPPLGVHPALVELVWARYDEALAGPAHSTHGRCRVDADGGSRRYDSA